MAHAFAFDVDRGLCVPQGSTRQNSLFLALPLPIIPLWRGALPLRSAFPHAST